MNYRPDQTVAVRALKNAAPYIRMFKGKVFVIKASGSVFGEVESTRALIEQVAILHQVGIKVVLVHGGGPQVTEISDALGITTRMVQGRRVTYEKSIDVTKMVLNATARRPASRCGKWKPCGTRRSASARPSTRAASTS